VPMSVHVIMPARSCCQHRPHVHRHSSPPETRLVWGARQRPAAHSVVHDRPRQGYWRTRARVSAAPGRGRLPSSLGAPPLAPTLAASVDAATVVARASVRAAPRRAINGRRRAWPGRGPHLTRRALQTPGDQG
jgi:hypothetical protein